MHKELTLPLIKTALVLVDLQEEHRLDQRYLVSGYQEVLGNARRLLDAARSNNSAVYHAAYVRDFGVEPRRPFEPVDTEGAPCFSDGDTELTAICPEVAPQENEDKITKQDASCFEGTSFAETLAEAGTEYLMVCGVWTEACIAATVRDAKKHRLKVVLVKDACGSGSTTMHQSGIVNLANRLYGGAVVDTATACSLLAGETLQAWHCEKPVPLRFDADTLAEIYDAL
ncbi:isochorismatase family protein [Leisingera sp. ANG-DT]|uniref:isochorismatase family protein n=1 Tax=Leisingera sp. ANG-DT TaxID=1577897 RepID=UPI00057FDF3C|nr:isochorismatase family protein [Leisingera sp. ANG-DT]KIC17755.1 isochorismatase [Leisingera sp. ANG-DT]